MGKTSSTLAALEELKNKDPGAFPVLILAPLRVASSTWPQEILKWDFNLSCICINGTPVQRRKLLDYLMDKDIERYRAIIAKLGIRK